MDVEPEWERFGRGDTRGALNFIDANVILRAVGLVRKGEVISLNRAMTDPGPSYLRRPPLTRHVVLNNQVRPHGDRRYLVINDDAVEFGLQGSTHWDSLAHFGLIEPERPGVYYGGAGLEETYPTPEPQHLGIQALAPAIVSRGVLIDTVAVLGEGGESLPPGATVNAHAIRECLANQRLALETGDAVLIYTGFERRFGSDMTEAGTADGGSVPGLDGTTVALWRDTQISALAADNVGLESVPPDFSVHIGALRNLGIPLGELWALDELAMKCRADDRYDFLLVSVPLNIPGAFASPANAVAIR